MTAAGLPSGMPRMGPSGHVFLVGKPRVSCCLSFDDLSWIARGRPRTAAERSDQDAATATEWNAWVRTLAAEADGRVGIEDRRGTDGTIYTAFWLNAPAWWSARRWRPGPGPGGTPGVVLEPVEPGVPLPGRVARVVHLPDLAAAPAGSWWDEVGAELVAPLREFLRVGAFPITR